MELDETRTFVTVVDAGSFTAAGRRLALPKSTVSRQVTRLEQSLGARLLQRTTRKLVLTETGEAYYARCKQAIDDIEEAQRLATDLSAAPRGELRVSMPFDLVAAMAAILPGFRERYPEVTLVFRMTQERTDLVAEGFDVAIRGGVLPDSGFVARRLGTSSMGLYASPRYLACRGRPERLEDLDDHDLISIGSTPQRGLLPLTGPEGVVRVSQPPWVTANEFSFVRALLLRDLGVGLLLSHLAHPEVEAGRLERVLPDHGADAGGLYAVYPSRQHLSPKVRVFVDYLAESPVLLGG